MSKQDNYIRHTLRIPAPVYEKVKAAADENSRSINGEIIACLESGGETLRDKFAGQALAGWIASFPLDAAVKPIKVAAFAYEVADAMLAARERR